MAIKRVSKHYDYNPRYDVEKFDLESITKENLVNNFLVLKQSDVTYSFMMELFGDFNGSSFINPYDTFTVPAHRYEFENKAGKIVSNTAPFTTTFGIWVFNIFFIKGFNFCKFFGGYINKEIAAGDFEDINQDLVYLLAEDKITTEQYTMFLDYTQFFMPFENILACTYSEEVLVFSRTIDKKKQELIAKNKDALDAGDFAVAEKIEKELIEYTKEYLKDNPGIDSYISGSGGNMGNNFKNMYIMKGAIRDPDPAAKKQFNIVTSSFGDGISAEEYSAIANSLAAGPYARAKKTEQGGYWEKLFGAALQSITLDEIGSDCGSTQYITVDLDKKNIRDYMYNYILDNGKLVELTSDNKDKYIGTRVKMRFSIFCKSKTGICNKCAGNLFVRRNATNIGLTCIQIPSTIKVKSLKAFHDSTITTTEMDPMKAFGIE